MTGKQKSINRANLPTKQNSMNEKEFNLQVLAKLVEIANVIFAKLSINIEGTFTAAELWEGKNSLRENIVIDYHGTQFDTYTVEVGTFKCSFTPERIFYAVWKFERLCGVKQENKTRFTYGEPEGETVSEKAMYKSNKGEIITRKKAMIKVYDNIAYSVEKANISPFVLYFLAGGIWYRVGDAPDKEILKARIKRLKQKDFVLNSLKHQPVLMDESINSTAPIFKALYEVLTAEACNDTKEERKSENKVENTLKTRERRIVITHQIESNSYKAEIRELQYIGNRLYKDTENLYYLHNEYCYILGGYTRGVAAFLKEQQDIQTKIISMIDEGSITTESAKILYEKLTGHTLGEPAKVEPVHKETHEDYPPEPYNKEKYENVASLATVKTRNVATSYERFQDRTICGRFQKNMRPNYLRQKVFPTESFQTRLKMSRFKPRYFVRYANHHSRVESAANQTGSGKSGGYSVVTIRGSAKRKGKINFLSP